MKDSPSQRRLADMRARVDADEAYSRTLFPEGTGQRARDDFAYALRRAGIEVLSASGVPRLADWLGARLSR